VANAWHQRDEACDVLGSLSQNCSSKYLTEMYQEEKYAARKVRFSKEHFSLIYVRYNYDYFTSAIRTFMELQKIDYHGIPIAQPSLQRRH
jgi:hypothetical protein